MEVIILVKKSLNNIAYDYLQESIIKQELLPGEIIVEQEISDLLGISRTPVREALKQLSAEGLVRCISGRGTFVEEISEYDVEEIFELRILFEEIALRSAINEFTNVEIMELVRTFEALSCENPPEEFYESDRKLHDMIINHAHNRRMINFLKTINSQMELLRRISSMTPNRLEESKKEHLEIIYAIKERNIDKAIAKLRFHLIKVEESTLTICKQVRFNSDRLV